MRNSPSAIQPNLTFYRNPIECLRALWADPAFSKHMSFAPEKRYANASQRVRLFTEMNTADFWWEIQGKLPMGSTVVPIIISTDKTELSQFTGDATAYPIYMTIGNIDSSIRRQPSRHAQILIGYLPTTAIEKGDMSDLTVRNARAQLFHAAVRAILEPLRDAAATGIPLKSSNGDVRNCHPILAVYAADYPEQSLVACTRYGSRCPKCKASKDEFSSGRPGDARNPVETLHTIHEADDLNSMSAIDDFLQPFGLNYVPKPFWADWEHADIHRAIAPDILHQLYQGMVKHLTAWARHVVGDDELDRRFKRAGLAHGLRHFSNGISHLSRVSGTEHKAIAKQLVACLAGYSCHTDETLKMMETALDEFHKHKDVFLNTGAAESLDLPKLHSLVHYTASIRLFGVTGGYNTEQTEREQTERLHIDLAKRGYEASNHREQDILPFMCSWLERREKMFRFATYLADRQGKTYIALKRPPKAKERPAVAVADTANDLHQSVEQIATNHGAEHFAEHLVTYIKSYVKAEWKNKKRTGPVPSYEIPAIGTLGFDVWHRVKFNTPDIQTLDAPDTLDVAHAVPARVRKAKRTKALPARFDPVMVEINGDGVAGEGGMDGIRVAQLRVVFELPEYLHVNVFDKLHLPRPGKLAYIEWFSKLGSVDDVTGMYSVRRSFKSGTQNKVRQAAVIEAIDLRRSCHFVAKLSGHKPAIPLHLTVDNLLERWTDFWINNFVDKAAYRSIY
ncbi:hypothetical protein EXIGLDRAFT_832092 [Exidia glandulosa HHB12029]|uniref:Uncharacterized protein n=1 Tax=Exidia glandulosa HHB12029 TaxID=1314781 RepID=A0A165LYW1_EXIGL|nr:hypothetical protein EXIGLDRAFT_832092 [Exidia glandulosa HHB12029]